MQTEYVKVNCRVCGRGTNHEVKARELGQVSQGTDGVDAAIEYQIVSCAGCETVSFRELVRHGDNEAESLFPSPTIRKARDDFEGPSSRMPQAILGMYQATMSAFNNGPQNDSYFILAAGGIRSMLEFICRDLRIEGITLEAKIDGLYRAGHLTQAHADFLQEARFLGNESLHTGKVPTEASLDALLKLFEDTVDALYIRAERFNEGEILDAKVVSVTDKGTVVRVGTSTKITITPEEGGGPSIDGRTKAPQVGERIRVKVLSQRDMPLVLSKLAADMAIKIEQDALRQKANAERAYWAAFNSVKRRDIVEGQVTRICGNGLEIDVIVDGVTIPGWVPAEEYERERRRPYRLNDRFPVFVIRINTTPGNSSLDVSHRLAVERQQSLTKLHNRGSASPLIAKVIKVFNWGAIVSVDGTDGIIKKPGTAEMKMRVADEIPVEIVEMDISTGYLEFKQIEASELATSDSAANVKYSEEKLNNTDSVLADALAMPNAR